MDDDAAFLRSDDEARALLKQYLQSMDVEIVQEMEKNGNWGFWIRFGKYPVLIDHQKGTHFCIVAFQITLKDESAINHLNELYEKNDARFIYELTRAFSSLLTGYSRIVERGRVIGFTVSKYIYPHHAEFNMRTLDLALQSVVSTGAVGAAFLKCIARATGVQFERGFNPEDADQTRLFKQGPGL